MDALHSSIVDSLRARRARLAGEIERAKAEYAEIERILHEKMRSIDMDVGGLKVLDELLAELEDATPHLVGATNGTPAQQRGS